MKTIALIGSLLLGASLWNMDWHLCGVVAFLPLFIINAAGILTIAFVWGGD